MMRRTFATGLSLVLALTCLWLVGCGGGGAGGGDKVEGVAFLLEDGATKYFKHQAWCPVCNGQGLHENYYADVDNRRIYFDKEECMKKFKNNQSEYLPTFDENIEKAKAHEGRWHPGMGD